MECDAYVVSNEVRERMYVWREIDLKEVVNLSSRGLVYL